MARSRHSVPVQSGAVPSAFAGPARAAAAAVADGFDEEDDEDARPRHPYTWLHFLALILVAFVLGFLIVLLWSRSASATDGAPTTAAPVSVSASAHPV